MMQWRLISELTDEEFDCAGMYRILIVLSDCNGPYHFSWANEQVFDADVLRQQPWTHFLILPEPNFVSVDLNDKAGRTRPS
jgi:hypothetical protein